MKIDKKSIVLIFIIIVIVIFYYAKDIKDLDKDNFNSVCFKNKCFNVEIVDDNIERQRGLMFRESLDNDTGMLFIFEKSGVYPFWMKNTLIPLDIIWIDEKKEVVYISKNTLICKNDPCSSYNPNTLALYVLEINAGKAEEIGLKVGDKLEFNLR